MVRRPAFDIELPGLDGLHLLGFLAAMGTLVTLDKDPSFPDLRMRWQIRGSWRPVISSAGAITRESVVTSLFDRLSSVDSTTPFAPPVQGGDIADNLTLSPADYRQYAGRAAATAKHDARLADFAAAFACDAIGDEQIQDTAFRTMSGAGHQHFLKFMRQLVESTSAQQIERALFEPWNYQDEGPSMRWDPEDDRRYALRWKEPATDKIRTVRGANRLAIEGLRLFPSVPRGAKLKTTAFSGERATDTKITWPLWSGALPCSVVRSVVAMRLISAAELDGPRVVTRDAIVTRRGISEVTASSRVTTGKFRNFTPSEPV